MTSWREQTSPEAQDDFDELLDAALGAAEEMLGSGDGLRPFALGVDLDGHLAGYATDGEPDGTAAELVDGLTALMTRERDALRAAAVVYDVTLGDGRDAIQVALEHRETGAPALVVAASYVVEAAGPSIGDLTVALGSPRIWS